MEDATDEMIPTRATLLVRLKDWRDQASWRDFFDTYHNLILGVALKAGLTHSEAEDVVQETMLSVAKYIPEFNYDRSTGSFKSWLLKMTRWRITDQLRNRLPPTAELPAHEPPTDTVVALPVDDPFAEITTSLDAVWNAEWEVRLLEAAINKVKRQLDPQKFQIFDFYVNKNWPPEKVAVTFGVNINQVYLAKHRVTEMITEEIKRLELEPGHELPGAL